MSMTDNVIKKIKATKTFKIGEYAKGGIIKVIVNKGIINIQIINMFDTSDILESFSTTISMQHYINCDAIERKLSDFLHDNTTSYYSGKIMNWLKDKTKISFFWC